MVPPVLAEPAGAPAGDGPPARPLTAAVVGAGTVARQHLACLSDLAGATAVAVCDLSPAVAESMAERFGVDAHFADHRRMLDEVAPDVVHVTTPPGAHYEVAMDALAAGAHAIVEKPVVADPSQLEPLLAEAGRRERVVVENYNYAWNPQLRQMRRLARSGELGELVHVEVDLAVDILGDGSPFADRNRPHPALALPGGAIADFLPHLASLAYFLAGPHRRVTAVWSKRRADSPLAADDLRALVESERATAAISFSATSQPDGFWVRVHGSRMRVEANLFEPRLTIERVRRAPAPLFPVLNGVSEMAALGRAAVSGLWGKLSGAPGAYAGLWELIARTYDAIGRGAQPPVTPTDIRAVNRMVADIAAEQRGS
jgi:predicted dehydrogenase